MQVAEEVMNTKLFPAACLGVDQQNFFVVSSCLIEACVMAALGTKSMRDHVSIVVSQVKDTQAQEMVQEGLVWISNFEQSMCKCHQCVSGLFVDSLLLHIKKTKADWIQLSFCICNIVVSRCIFGCHVVPCEYAE